MQVANQRGHLPDQRATPSRCQRWGWCRHGRCSGLLMMYSSSLGWRHNYAWDDLCFGCFITLWRCLDSYEFGMASCGSSTHEGASDVSLFHTCFTSPPGTCRVACWVCLLFVLGCLVFVVCVCLSSCFAGVRGILTIPPRVRSRWPTMLHRSFG